MKQIKQDHRSNKKANDVPKSATFSPRKSSGIPEHFTFSGASKKRK